jgi:uncharacterized protein (DUF362 family)/Pyruvate/2-oxoacid:ferredoxin oxidoreductase delta subunit
MGLNMDKISVYGCKEYDSIELDEQIEKHFLALDENGTIIKNGSKVVIKPNLLIRRSPEDATTTHPRFVEAIIKAVQKRGGIAIIAESPGGPYTKALLKSVYTGTGMEEAANNTGAMLNYDVGYSVVKAKNGKVCTSFNIIDPIKNADVIISVAKLKTHAMTNMTCAVKNMFGAVPGLMKPEFHFRYPQKELFGEMLIDLCETVKPQISFVDAIVGMEGNGPSGGKPRFIGVTLAGLNPHALDLFAASLIGFNASDVPTLRAAINRGLCPEKISELEIVGDDYKEFEAHDFKKPDSRNALFISKLPAFLKKPLVALVTPKPVIRTKNCIGCGKCAESCPQQAITILNKKAVIDYSKCIKCYCCHEMCPVKSIDIKRLRLLGK